MNKSISRFQSDNEPRHSSRIWPKAERVQHITIHRPDVLIIELLELNRCIAPFFRCFETLEHRGFLNHYSMPFAVWIGTIKCTPYAF